MRGRDNRPRLWFSTWFLLTATITGCRVGGPSADTDGGADGATDGPRECSACHGGPTNAAPPRGVDDEEATTDRAVGAHQAHLAAADWHAPVACDECHQVPAEVDAPGHVGMRPAELTWGARARNNGADPAFDGARCSGVYCHGATLSRGSNTTPRWTLVDNSQDECGSCHGLPPAEPHPQSDACPTCHQARYDDPQLHINGTIDVVGIRCNSCHGSDANAAPPVDTRGSSATTEVGVGAHQQHLAVSDWHRDVACHECHVLPATVDAAGHVDTGLPAELVWGTLATTAGATPSFEQAAARCAGTYCHGSTLPDGGGSNLSPTWTRVGAGEAACGSCHSLPPGGVHPVATDCSRCHGEVVAADRSWVDRAKHIDGVVEVAAGGCSGCHGTADGPAPPPDTSGATATSARGVGAHASHLAVGSDWHRNVACSECHVVPSSSDAPGHRDTAPPADLTWGPLATSDGSSPSFDGTTCSGTYCHGAALDGGSNVEPAWTTVDGTQAACGTCHGLPPPDPHPANANCYMCHPSIVDSSRGFVDPTRHINGRIDY